ncbi:signal recognition particle protein Srp54 [Nanoarchaeota archaeon]
MVLEKLGSSLKDTLGKIAKAVFVDEKLVNELVKDIQRALLQSDVNVKLVFELSKKIKDRILKEDTPSGLTKKEYLVNVVYEELVTFLGAEAHEIKIEKKPFKIMMVGLFGSGKTTTSGKLAKYFMKRGHKVGLVGLDIHRPAAMDQIEQIANDLKVPVFIDRKKKDVIAIWDEYEKELAKFDILIVDTAGRDALSDDLIEELGNLNKHITPDENLLVISADIGQAAQSQAEKFHETCGITGVIATKLDGTAKAGGALSACAVTGAPIKFIGVGEKADDLESFNPKGFVGRLLGMGDLEALLEKAKGAISEEQAEDLGKKFLKGKFNLIDLYEQMEAMSKMGPLGKVMEMIPGMGQLKLPKDMVKVQEGKLKTWRFIMNSCTKEELEEPDIMSPTRIDRVAAGAGLGAKDVRELLKQYRQSKKMVKMLKGGAGSPKDMQKLMKKMQGGGQQVKFR